MKINRSTTITFRGEKDIEFLKLTLILAHKQLEAYKQHMQHPRITIGGVDNTFHVEVLLSSISDTLVALNRPVSTEVKPYIDYQDKEK